MNSWIPKGPRPYTHSVATTWIISFNEIRKNNSTVAHFFQLLAFFNPDGILIEFLKSGTEGMDNDLERLIFDEFEISEALSSLEMFSLIKWVRQNSKIVIHRLVQAVVKDEMSEMDLTTFYALVVDICNRAFPREWDKSRALRRLYIGQVIGQLVDPDASETLESANVMHRVGWFVREDGKTIDSERILLRSWGIFRRILGEEHPDTLASMSDLAIIYRVQGRTGEAAALQEEVLQKRRRILGEEHPDTLRSMNNLANTYSDQGRTAEAAALHEEVLQKQRRILGEEHPDTLTSMANLALTYRDRGKTAESAALQDSLRKRRRILGDEHPHTLPSMVNEDDQA